MNPLVTMGKIFAFCLGTIAMVMFPPVIETWTALGAEIPQKIVRGCDFAGVVDFGGGMGPEGYSIAVDWPRLALQLAALAFVIALFRRPKRKLETNVVP